VRRAEALKSQRRRRMADMAAANADLLLREAGCGGIVVLSALLYGVDLPAQLLDEAYVVLNLGDLAVELV